MAWPPALSNTSGPNIPFSQSNLPTTIAWGTDGILAATIVISCRTKLITSEPTIENGSGLTATLIGIQDGEEVTLDVVDDRNISTWPNYFAILTITDPSVYGGNGSSVMLRCLSSDYNAERKQEGRRSFLARKYTLFT